MSDTPTGADGTDAPGTPAAPGEHGTPAGKPPGASDSTDSGTSPAPDSADDTGEAAPTTGRRRTAKTGTAKRAAAGTSKRASSRTAKSTAAASPGDAPPAGDAASTTEEGAGAAAEATVTSATDTTSGEVTAAAAPAKKAPARKRATRKAAPASTETPVQPALTDEVTGDASAAAAPAAPAAPTAEDAPTTPPARKTPSRRTRKTTSPPAESPESVDASGRAEASTEPAVAADASGGAQASTEPAVAGSGDLFVSPSADAAAATTADEATAPAGRQRTRRRSAAVPLFQAPTETAVPPVRAAGQATAMPFQVPAGTGAGEGGRDAAAADADADGQPVGQPPADRVADETTDSDDADGTGVAGSDTSGDDASDADDLDDTDGDDDDDEEAGAEAPAAEGGSSRRRRRRGGRGRRRKPAGEDGADTTDESPDGPSGSSDGSAAGSSDKAPDEASDDAPAEVAASGSTRSSRSRSRSSRSAASSDEPTGSAGSGDADGDAGTDTTGQSEQGGSASTDDTGKGTSSSSRRRRSRRRAGEATEVAPSPDDPPVTVVRVREPRPSTDDDVTSLKGSTRLEAKKQRRRDGRDQGRRRPPVITEAEFLARREAVDRVMVVRQSGSRTQIAVLEDGVLVEHYVAQASQTSSVGNVYLGKVQNVLPAMEAAFIDIGKGRNAVLYAGEVAWSRMGMDGKARRMESVLSSGQSVLVQVTKDPVGSKGARLTGLVSLPGRFLVYAPGGQMSGISRKLPEKERARLKAIVKKVFPDEASVIIRTAAEGASEEELSKDIHRLEAQWQDIEAKAKTATSPARLYAEPDLAIKVVRDMFNEDFASLVVSGDEAWDTLHSYVDQVAPDLVERLQHWTSERDVFAEYRVDEQIAKALDRKVWLPSGGSLVIDRTEAMTVVDVNTGKFTGSGGNLEATVTKNNLEAAEEIVRQIRLRDIGGIIVIDFIDMVLENNRDLVLRRLVECLGRDRTRHQVAEVTSLGLVQMTRKRVGQGLLDVFSEPCEVCNGRGVKIYYEPVDAVDGESHAHEQTPQPASGGRSESSRGGRGRRGSSSAPSDAPARPGPADVIRAVAMAASNSRQPLSITDELVAVQVAGDDAVAGPDEVIEVFDRQAPEDAGEIASSAEEPESADTTGTGDTVSAPAAVHVTDSFGSSGPVEQSGGVDQPADPTPPSTDAASGDGADDTDVETAESGRIPGRRSRRSRSTRRPAGPPRPSAGTPVPPVVTAPTQSAAVGPRDVTSPDEGSPGSELRQPAGESPTIAPMSDSPGATVEATPAAPPRNESSSEPERVQPGSDGAGDSAGSADSDQPTSRPRRRRVTRPAGAPTA